MIENSLIESTLTSRLKEKNPLIQIILGPRQVGKTSAIHHLIETNKFPNLAFFNADGIQSSTWIEEAWQKAQSENKILVIDEIQKIPNWSETVKKLWDNSISKRTRIKCVFLGSSSLHLSSGISESLAGRFEIISAPHWDYQLSHKLLDLSLDDYIIYGGYPGSYPLINFRKTSAQQLRWRDFMTSSIVEAVITKDILTQARIKSPGLFRQCFYILSNFPAHIVSYNKILGQLQDKGNIDLVKYYVDLYESAFLIKPIYKFSKNEVRKKQSLPKFICMAPGLSTFHRLDNLSKDYLGHVFESLVACQLLKCGISLSYWAEGNYEVDLVFEYKKQIIAVEVKSGRNKKSISLEKFKKKYPSAKLLFIDKENYIKFEKSPIEFVEKILF